MYIPNDDKLNYHFFYLIVIESLDTTNLKQPIKIIKSPQSLLANE